MPHLVLKTCCWQPSHEVALCCCVLQALCSFYRYPVNFHGHLALIQPQTDLVATAQGSLILLRGSDGPKKAFTFQR
eukprot:Skav235575  [mRNA]  locus=scaffold612:57653:59097:- [translate_table: standard]